MLKKSAPWQEEISRNCWKTGKPAALGEGKEGLERQ